MPPLERNEQVVLDLLAGEPNGLTRTELRQRSHLSKPTIQGIVHALRRAELITRVRDPRVENGDAPTGRPAERWVLARQAGLVMGLDLGHGHAFGAVADRSGSVLGELEENRNLDVDRIGAPALGIAVDLLAQALKNNGASETDVHAVGVGIPAAIDDQGRVLFTDYLPTWATVDIPGELHALLSERFPRMRLAPKNIRVENDANLGALGEGLNGAASGQRDYLYLKASTGIGMGLILDGRIHRGVDGAAGEFGHVSVSPMADELIKSEIRRPVAECPRCRKVNCLENTASCGAIVRQLRATDPAYPADLTIQDVIARARDDVRNHPLCMQAIVEAGIRIGYTLVDVLRIYAPECVVVGGLLAEAKDILTKQINEAIEGAKGMPATKIVIVESDRIIRSEVEGAIALALQAKTYRSTRQ
ncbi:MAG TPA: ROK family transcriptional regulator [Solirubrobacteraceae bacterium]|jgi:predicted NBD/HSP70 family sugar kinase